MTCGVNEKSKYIIISARKYFALLCFYSNTISAQMTNPSKRENSKKKIVVRLFANNESTMVFLFYETISSFFHRKQIISNEIYTSSKHRWSDMIVDIVGCTLFFVLRFRKKTVLVFNFYQWPKTSIRRYLFCCQYFSFPWLQYCTTEYPIGRIVSLTNRVVFTKEKSRSKKLI